MIRPAKNSDTQAIVDIYNYYIVNSTVTFEEKALDAADISERIQETESQKLPYIVCEKDGLIVGYAYASKWKGRCAYQFSVEITVYLAPQSTGEGHGTALYEALFSELRKRSLHVAIAGIALPNPGSVALHEGFGMKKVAHFEEVGFKFGAWVDVGYWHCKL
jgi:L-amino acid N-acyltransferase YncA